MKKACLIAPLAALALFGGLYAAYSIRRDATVATQQAQAAAARRDKAERDQAALVASREAAATAAAERQRVRLAREQQEAAQKDALAAAEQRRTHAFEHERKLRSQIDRRRADVARATESLAVLTPRQQELAAESAFLTDYLQRADPNREAYYRLLENLEAADKLAAAAPAPANHPKPGGQ
ncbi:MAG: hypothetical protein NTV51_09590 [Verrucomicrobia bacterium]|nr:hypothetical protein [Verrucomicrobiota bacterium]